MDREPSPAPPEARKRRKGPLYKLKAAIQGLAGSKTAAAEVYGGEEYQRVVEKAEEIFFSVSIASSPFREPLRSGISVIRRSRTYTVNFDIFSSLIPINIR